MAIKLNEVKKTLSLLGENLRHNRESQKLRQIDVAPLIGVSLVTLRKIESGDIGASIWSYAKYAEILKLQFPEKLEILKEL